MRETDQAGQAGPGLELPKLSIGELEDAVRNSTTLVELVQNAHADAVVNGDAAKAAELLVQLAALRELCSSARAQLVAALDTGGSCDSSRE
ncbi:hypothetical protein FN976_25650 [Caenimonas sedimenti]|uniref:Uncharacterized protein n=1 Tax=Caenimonas sedimenti TaxID=2596921 RepID=A0A562ZGY2_9BURK|nr:hypothetical protein [Caenimonas sedimenti]TWO67773.1 hypothetical protein FN976_25650 [Caenimonas sedimenti]